MLGAVRQELLSGISDFSVFKNLKAKLRIFEDYIPQTSDYELAAEYFNVCRKNGIQGSATDYLICAIAIKNDWVIFSEDTDFLRYRKYIPIKIHGR
jgi:predicted nucleic acid-binding protein